MPERRGLSDASTGWVVLNPTSVWDKEAQERMLAGLLRPSLGIRRGRQCARALIGKFGSLPQVLAAPRRLIEEVKGVGRRTAAQLALILQTAQCIAKDNLVDERPILCSWSALLEYCRATMAYESVEQFRILFLDKKNRLIADEVQQVGTVDHTPLYPREVIRRTLELSACALILVHNHPAGDPSPSAADVRMTREIAEITKQMGITLHDHIIVGRAGHVSMRGLKLI
ncbi:MAG: DNA repair protein RadC [Devosia sp.]|nr:DNA repair protein RadC [Devosia sp.]